jgi:hypothetical protein
VERFRSAEARTARTIERADRMMAEGRFDAALAELHAANRREPDVEVERRIARYRHEAFFLHRPTSREAHWPPAVEDLFPGETRVPSIDAAQLTVDHLRSGVLRHGALVVRGLLRPEQVAVLKKDVKRAIGRFDGKPGDDDPWYHPLEVNPACPELTSKERSWTRSTGGCFAADSPRSLVHYIDMLSENGITEMIDGYLGERPALSVRKTTLRKVPPNYINHEWHQDGAFLGDGIRTINLWVALTPCGVDAPTLDMIPRRLDELAPRGVEGASFDWTVSNTVTERIAGDLGHERLIFDAGDAVLFDEMNLHRTATSPEMTKPRFAIESWFFASSCYPMRQVPLLV